MRKKKYIMIIALTAASLLVAGVIYYNLIVDNSDSIPPPARDNSDEKSEQLIRECPQEWYDNRMPPAQTDKPPEERQYFIINDKAYRYSEVDVQWVKQNCEVNEPEVIY